MLRDCCSDTVKVAAIIGGAIIVAVAMWLYFSPYQSCVRARISANEINYPAMERAFMVGISANECTPN